MVRGRILGCLALVAVVAAAFVFPNVAHADPHAVFYTAIGQRQLFFNFLAALDQADYVEPATGNFSREELLQRRNQAILTHLQAIGLPVDESYIGRQDPALQATNTNLSAVVTRPVTLEGSDLFSSQLLFDHSREIARRAGTAALLAEVFCDQALGREDCGNSPTDYNNRDRGYVADPVKFATFPLSNGALANLTSGDPAAMQLRQDALNKGRKGFSPGFTSDPFIAQLRQNLKDSGSNAALTAFNSRALGALTSFYPLVVDPTIYDGLEVTEDGSIKLAQGTFDSGFGSGTALAASGPPVSDPAYDDWYLSKMSRLLHFDSALIDSAATGARAINTILDTSEDQGEVADLTLVPRTELPEECNEPGGFCPLPDKTPDPTDLSILPTVRVPVVGKTSQFQTAIQALSDLNTNLASVGSPYRIQDPIGNVPLLNPPPGGDVEGARTGSVLASTDPETGEQLRQLFGPAPYFGVNDIVPQGEAALRQFLIAIKGRAGCGCNISTVTNAFGTPLLNKINSFAP